MQRPFQTQADLDPKKCVIKDAIIEPNSLWAHGFNMEEVLKYLLQIALSGAAFSFVIGLIKWIDQRNRDQEEKQYQSFHKMVCLASGTDENLEELSKCSASGCDLPASTL
jgi:hypothetical protein